jgi:cellulose synthase operon protein C
VSDAPVTARLVVHIPKPKDWQQFQRACHLLFRRELNDPHAQEYGRSGQRQHGIDILGRRNQDSSHHVGVQCKLIQEPLTDAELEKEARAALKLPFELKELVFATTAPDNARTTDAAIRLEETLRDEGIEIRIVVYGWESLQHLIALHDDAYAAFNPAVFSNSSQKVIIDIPQSTAMASDIVNQLVAQVRGLLPNGGVNEPTIPLNKGEDAALHARIDEYRNLLKEQMDVRLLERQLLSLDKSVDKAVCPWAYFRVQTNLGATSLRLGRFTDAVRHYQLAYDTYPDEPVAIVNLSLARLLEGQFDAAMDLARRALELEPTNEFAVSYLLQAAARSTWGGNPQDLIPEGFETNPRVALALAEFLMRKEVLGWPEQVLEIARRHPGAREGTIVKSTALLTIASRSTDIEARLGVSREELLETAKEMGEIADNALIADFENQKELIAYVNNAALLYRVSGLHSDSHALLHRAMPLVKQDAHLRRLLALSHAMLERSDEAIAILADDDDDANMLLSADLLASAGRTAESLVLLDKIKAASLPDDLRQHRLVLIATLSEKIGDESRVTEAIIALRSLDPSSIHASIFEIRRIRRQSKAHEQATRDLVTLAESARESTDATACYFLALELVEQGFAEEASWVLQRHVDLTSPSQLTALYLQCLAAARRDVAFRSAIATLPSTIRDSSSVRWTIAAHSWNCGDLESALAEANAILELDVNDARARLLKIEILIRQDRSTDVFAELDKSIEELDWKESDDEFRIASLLANFGHLDRAAAFAYRLFLQHRDLPRAWITLSMVLLGATRAERSVYELASVEEHAAVRLRYEDGSQRFFIVEPDPALRRLDSDSWEPKHAVVQACLGLKVGDRVSIQTGQEAIVEAVLHKYVARFQYVMQQYEIRFPEVFGFSRLDVNLEAPDGLKELIAKLKSRYDWVRQEEEKYVNGPWPIAVLAHNLGEDTIDVSASLAAAGRRLKVAAGDTGERTSASSAIRANQARGCVLDLLALWTAWKLEALETVRAVAGQTHVPRSVVDRLLLRRSRLDESIEDGLRSASYNNGKISLAEMPAESVRQARDDVDACLKWIETNGKILPLIASEELSSELKEFLRSYPSDVFDALVASTATDLLLVTDDLPTRQVAGFLGKPKAVWLHSVFGEGLDRRIINQEQYVEVTARLVDTGHWYLGISGISLALAAWLDEKAGNSFRLFGSLSEVIGGNTAEISSHVNACLICIISLWSDPKAGLFRERATSFLLSRLLRERTSDYKDVLRALYTNLAVAPPARKYVREWARGHFMSF